MNSSYRGDSSKPALSTGLVRSYVRPDDVGYHSSQPVHLRLMLRLSLYTRPLTTFLMDILPALQASDNWISCFEHRCMHIYTCECGMLQGNRDLGIVREIRSMDIILSHHVVGHLPQTM
jgi:hypothetical protein